MNKITSDMENIGWHFDNSYTRLPDIMMSKIKPIPVKKPKLVILNSDLSNELGLNFSNTKTEILSSLLSGNI